MSDWLKRPYDRALDEDGILFTWLRSYAHSKYGVLVGAHVKNSPEAYAFWDKHKPFVLELMRKSTIEVVCDASNPQIMWGWVAYEGPTLHYVLVKRAVKKAGFCVDVLNDLLKGHLDKPCGHTFELVEMRGMWDEFPTAKRWYPDFTFFHRKEAA